MQAPPLNDLILVAAVLAASFTDIRRRRIPNLLTGPALVAGLAIGAWSQGTDGLWYSLQGAALGGALLVLLFLASAMGAGDVKLLAAVGALQGPMFVLVAAMYMGICGGVLAALALVRRGQLASTVAAMVTTRQVLVSTAAGSGLRVPYGPAIAVGSVLALLTGW